MLDIQSIKQREQAATPGPWQYDGQHDEITCPRQDADGYWIICSECRTAPSQEPSDQFGHQFSADFEFIAHAREDVPALIAEIERLRDRPTRNIYCWRPVGSRKIHLLTGSSLYSLCGNWILNNWPDRVQWYRHNEGETCKLCLREINR